MTRQGRYLDKVRQTDASGRLIAAGVHWEELHPLSTFCQALAGVIIVIVALATWLAFNLRPDAAWPSVLFLTMAGLLFFDAWRARRDRLLLFHEDGRITMPWRLRPWGWKRTIPGDHANLVSIEAEADRDHWSRVVMFSRGGDKLYLTGGRLHSDTSRKIAVQLTRALAAIREAVAAGADAPAAGVEVTVLID
ncbi:MAG: hypothetical protein KIT76_00980 [Pseudolabrys sp.]|nr:hypothetical protein [Pseudolabrys sp.]MCW5696130.1 hypothetical protein [Bauldia sp.]